MMAFIANLHNYVKIALIVLSCALIAWLFIGKWGRKWGRLWLNYAAMTVPFTVIITLLLVIFAPEDATVMILLTAGVMGGFVLLVVLNFILMKILKTDNTQSSFQALNALLKSKRLFFLRISLVKDIFMVLSKTILSVIAVSFFMFTNALYSAGLGVARLIAVKMHKQSGEKQLHSYFLVGGVIFLASVCYVIYSIRLFYKSSTTSFPMVVGIAIACYTFVEFGINIREAWRLRKNNALEVKALRAISLSSTLLCFVLTQTALTSLTPDSDPSFYNALSGVIFGGIAALVGAYVMLRSKMLKAQ